ncbi:hypothetical protein [Sutterella sp.]|uniref:hypothetical protein n=1 Tax=Sutterella sp. TaxID=1981025 RepID=UPI003FD7C742
MQKHQLAALAGAVLMALSAGHAANAAPAPSETAAATATEATGSQASDSDKESPAEKPVSNVVKGMLKALTDARKAEQTGGVSKTNAESAKTAKEDAYPAVPAKYLRPNADKKEQAAAVKQLKKNVAAEDAAAAEAARKKPESAPVGQVRINSNPVIAVKPGENVFIPISREHPNRILTPFKNPQIVSTSLFAGKKKGECGEACVRDGVIYITTDAASAVTAFITEKGHEDIAFSLTMVPQAIPPREVRFTLPADVVERLNLRSGDAVGLKKAQAWETSQPYVETIRQALRGVALGNVPSGYNLRKLRVTDPRPTCSHPGLSFKWDEGQILEGYNLDIYVGVIENTADSPVEFREQNCGGWRTAAVTSWPLTVLEPGQKTEIYVVVKRQDETPNELVRKPLIPREYN